MINQKFGKLTVIKDTRTREKYGQILWECLCDCGNRIIVKTGNLRSGHTKSCGCLFIENLHKRKHVKADKKILKNNKSGYTGVYWNSNNQKWRAQIVYKKQKYRLGSYETIEEAVEARNQFIINRKIDKEYKIRKTL